MIKRPLITVLGVFSVCFSVDAQQTSSWQRTQAITFEQLSLYRPEVLSAVDSSTLIDELPMLALLDGQCLPIATELGRMGMTSPDLSPVVLLANAAKHQANASPEYKAVAPREVTPSRFTPEYISGEVGFLYGRSTGKFGGDVMESYIMGTTGNDKFQISFGASYEEFSGRVPRWAR
jgi:hypothetical protein